MILRWLETLRCGFVVWLTVACGSPMEEVEFEEAELQVAETELALTARSGRAGSHGHDGRHSTFVKTRDVRFDVTLSDGESYEIAGTLYYQGSLYEQNERTPHRSRHHSSRPHRQRSTKVLQVAVHGATYDSGYWDVPEINGQRYSYARYMARHGYAVLAIDQLGTGESDQPPGDFLNLAETALGLDQVVDALRSRRNPIGARFETIVLVGHSNGALTSIFAQAHHASADGLVVTGWVHGSVPPVDPTLFDPLLVNPYVFAPPEIRTPLFYYPPGADPDVIAFDATELNSPLSRGQLVDLLNAQFVDPDISDSEGVEVPVLVQVGEQDFLMMFAPLSGEVARYPASPEVSLRSLEETGHSLTTHLTSVEGFRQIRHWLDVRF